MSLPRAEIEELYREVGQAVYRRCLKILRHRDEAVDATQEVFVRILRHQDRLPPRAERLRWAYAIATRISLNRIRDGVWERHQERLDSACGDALVAPGPGAEWAGARGLAAQVLAPHDETTRLIAWLVLVDGMTQEEAGELVGLSRKTVGKKLAAFLASARQLLAVESA